MNESRCCLSLVKGVHRYVFWFSEGQEAALLNSLVRCAADPDSELDWFDAAVLSFQLGRRAGCEAQALGALP